MLLNKILIWWFRFDVTTKAPFLALKTYGTELKQVARIYIITLVKYLIMKEAIWINLAIWESRYATIDAVVDSPRMGPNKVIKTWRGRSPLNKDNTIFRGTLVFNIFRPFVVFTKYCSGSLSIKIQIKRSFLFTRYQ